MIRLATALLLLASPAAAIELVEFGVICEITTDGQRQAPLTESGVINSIDQSRAFDVTTTGVPAHLGLSFGLRILLPEGETSHGTRMSVTHPPLGKRGVTTQSWSAPLTPGAPALNLFTFEKPYEMVQGTWTFAVIDDRGKRLELSFEVLPPGSVPQVQTACFDPAPMS
ncbi:DUF3859 domain-containing protein [Primorskyibacter sp. 2E107]|uniref:DUF3859 domain-containing protein n=1 Tax=Primorskyibacter sp. 2E107 TaxID=3403458 RepID=UPI003AF932BE